VFEVWRRSGTWLSIGTFDGVHLGHRALIKQLVAGANKENLPAILITFFPSPAVVLRGQNGPYYLSSLEDRLIWLGDLGVDGVITLTFDKELASLTAGEFMRQLKEKFNIQQVLVGFNFALGRGRGGDLQTLSKIGEQIGYHLQVVPPITIGGLTISSSQIRSWLADGVVDQVARGLGRWFALSGVVAHGDGRGRSLGIPTANLEIWNEQAIPANGVYAGWAWVDDKRWKAVISIGTRLTFEEQPVASRVEAHLLEFDQDLYGKILRLEFVTWLRNERRFDSVQALIDQIDVDKKIAQEILKLASIEPMMDTSEVGAQSGN